MIIRPAETSATRHAPEGSVMVMVQWFIGGNLTDGAMTVCLSKPVFCQHIHEHAFRYLPTLAGVGPGDNFSLTPLGTGKLSADDSDFRRFFYEFHSSAKSVQSAESRLSPFKTKHGSSLFSMGTFPLAQEGPGGYPQMTQITTDIFMSSAHLLNLRDLRIVLKDR
jgi:hypothetical protein